MIDQKAVIFFIGPQGSGKGTQAKMLAERLGFFYWEMGAICREKAAEDSDLGRRVKNLTEQGVLLDDELLLEVAREKLATLPADRGIIFDGIPRRVGQAQFLMAYLKEHGRGEFVTLYLSLPREESIERLLRRAQIEERRDDTREAIETRFRYYENDTVPVLEYLQKETHFIEIDGRPPIAEVAAHISRALEI